MPTSNIRSGKARSNRSSPVPVGMAPVMATMRGSAAASAIRASANTLVEVGGLGAEDLACWPVDTSNLPTAWPLSAEEAAGW